MYTVDINISPAVNAFNSVLHALSNESLFRKIAGTLESETEENFAEQGRPSWTSLKPSTIAARLKRNNGSSVLKILLDQGNLAGSVSSESGADFALVGAGGERFKYAAIHQLGGDAGKGHHAHIPQRPYLPFTGTISSPKLQPEAEQSVLDIISRTALDSFR